MSENLEILKREKKSLEIELEFYKELLEIAEKYAKNMGILFAVAVAIVYVMWIVFLIISIN